MLTSPSACRAASAEFRRFAAPHVVDGARAGSYRLLRASDEVVVPVTIQKSKRSLPDDALVILSAGVTSERVGFVLDHDGMVGATPYECPVTLTPAPDPLLLSVRAATLDADLEAFRRTLHRLWDEAQRYRTLADLAAAQDVGLPLWPGAHIRQCLGRLALLRLAGHPGYYPLTADGRPACSTPRCACARTGGSSTAST